MELKILIVEDNPVNQALLAKILKKENATTAIANDGRQGLKMALEDNFDFIFMDINMPIMSGYEATTAIREAKPSSKIIACSGSTKIQDQHKSMFHAIIPKPYDIEKIKRIINHR